MQGQGYCFRSDLFAIEPGEDEETNPRRYGRALARWLAAQLAGRGYPGASASPDDWGWRIECASPSFRRWVGCGNMDEDPEGSEHHATPASSDVTWHCFPVVDVPLLSRLLRRGSEAARQLERLDADLRQILASEPRITLVDAP